MKAIVDNVHISNAVNSWTTDGATAFCHVIAERNGAGLIGALRSSSTGLFIFRHPVLGDWTSMPSVYKSPIDNGPLHRYSGTTPDDPDDQIYKDGWAGDLDTVECYMLGHIIRHANGLTSNDRPFVMIEFDDGIILDSYKPGSIVWETSQNWSSVNARYKNHRGDPRADVDPRKRPFITVT